VTSESNAGKYVHSVHPNLRKRTELRFVASADLKKSDLLFLCLPHGMAMGRIAEFLRWVNGSLISRPIFGCGMPQTIRLV
jgi:N-acetyl-gamma-glutamyl-phosphate/LysW-gamma-L-alpha-aminoadipyl-6-phosphate reductase